MYESDIDIKIYNKKTRETFYEKSLGIFSNDGKLVAAGNECAGYMESHPGDSIMCTPFMLGKISDFKAAEVILRSLLDKHIGKGGLFSSKQDILFAFHEPLNYVERKMFVDLGLLMGHREVKFVECTNEQLAKYGTWEAMVWDYLDNIEPNCKCAIEFTKNDRFGFAELATQKLLVDGLRWGVDKEELIDMIKNCDESRLRKDTYHCY